MSQIVVPFSTVPQFTSVTLMAEVRDENGRLLGRFVPEPDHAAMAKLEPQIDEAELRRRLAEGGGRPLSEIWKDLGVKE